MPRPVRTSLLSLLVVASLALPASAAEEAPPEPGASEPIATGPTEAEGPTVTELGGTWRRMTAAPFGALDVPGGWTGTELVVADPKGKRRASSYLPALDSWSSVARPPRKLLAGSETHWTGSELLFVEPRGTARRGLTLYDPVGDAWRTSAPAPFNEITDSAWADGRLVVAAASGGGLAMYDLETDTWAELPPLPDAELRSLHSTGEAALALVLVNGSAEIAFVPLDLEAGVWGEPRSGPLTEASAEPLWTGAAFVSLTAPTEPLPAQGPAAQEDAITPAAEAVDASLEAETVEAPPGADADATLTPPTSGAAFVPASGEWQIVEDTCGIDTSGAVWAEPLILDVDGHVGLDPETGQCYELPTSPWAERSGALRVWTGNEVLVVSGDTGAARPRRDGVAYDPYPGDDSLGVVLDEPSRPVRVRVPSLGIDLPVISDSRKVPGSTPGYPACDVALSWSLFDRPGTPGTAWILAHAQRGMFLPLLETLQARGKAALLGREVEVQLRDGRVLTYRTYRVNPRATNTNIGLKGRKADEHRLVLQTSTGVGSAPKLLVAARLVDVGTTDEPRPKPRPRACG